MSTHLPTQAVNAALAAERSGEARRIREAVHAEAVLGVFGEAEVGKTRTIQQALAGAGVRVLRLDLRWAAGEAHAAFLLAGEMARTLAPGMEPARLARPGPLPPEVERARSRLVETLGGGMQEALRRWPSGRYRWAAALESLELCLHAHELLLWIDHLEAPGLSFRHPLDLQQLLWSLSEIVQRNEGLKLLVSGREAASPEMDGPRAAFCGHGRRMSLRAPDAAAWRRVADLLDASPGRAEELAVLTGGHPRTMARAIAAIAGEQAPASAEAVLDELAAADDGLTARALEHARSLHRLGGQVLTQAALGQRPYATAQRGAVTTQELSKALKRLRLAGLLRHQERWSVVDPLLAMRLRACSATESPTAARRPWS
jgi:hypothetical protein